MKKIELLKTLSQYCNKKIYFSHLINGPFRLNNHDPLISGVLQTNININNEKVLYSAGDRLNEKLNGKLHKCHIPLIT